MIQEDENYYSLLNHLEEVSEVKKATISEKEKSTNSIDDARTVIFSQFSNVINDYFSGILCPLFFIRIRPAADQGTISSFFPNQKENSLYEKLSFFLDHAYIKTWHDMVKVRFVSGMWTIFEDYIDIIFSEIADDQAMTVQMNSSYRRIEKHLAGKVDDVTMELIREELKSGYIDANNKYNYIFNRLSAQVDRVQLKEYRKFLEFFNILRNTLHRNSRPLKSKTFRVSFGTFTFEKDKHIDCFTFEVILESLNTFLAIFKVINTCLEHQGEITNPAVFVK